MAPPKAQSGLVGRHVERFVALDRLRALAVVSMVQGHTFTALLADGELPHELKRIHSLIHGLTAPAFLFGAGLAFGVATYPRYAQHREGGAPLQRRLRRYAGLLAIGYALQLPGSSLFAALRLQGDQLVPVLRVGPLQLIALCLGVAQLAVLLFRSPARHALAALVLGLLLMFTAPLVWTADASAFGGVFVASWLDGRTGSLFPIFPWASYTLLGTAASFLLTQPAQRAIGGVHWLLAGLATAGASYALFRAGVRLADEPLFWRASPLFVCFRLGLVLIVLGLLHAGTERARSNQRQLAALGGHGRASWSALLARHSLAAYVCHLLLLYGTPLTPSLHHKVGGSLTAPEATAVFVLLMLLTAGVIKALTLLGRQRELTWVRVALTLFVAALIVR